MSDNLLDIVEDTRPDHAIGRDAMRWAPPEGDEDTPDAPKPHPFPYLRVKPWEPRP